MGTIIEKIYLENFKKFKKFVLIPNMGMNVLIGDNEAGKSSILEAIDIVASGNMRRIEEIGIDHFFNIEAVNDFLTGEHSIDRLPVIRIELYLSGNFEHTMNGRNNSDKRICDGIRLVCAPNRDYTTEITEAINANIDYFPYDYYSVRFSTFADEPYTRFKKKLRARKSS